LEGAQWKKKCLADLNFVIINLILGLNEYVDASHPFFANSIR
jgi:hypothetical protein